MICSMYVCHKCTHNILTHTQTYITHTNMSCTSSYPFSDVIPLTAPHNPCHYDVSGTCRAVASHLVLPRTSDKKLPGEGIWHWETMSESEDEAWRVEDTDSESETLSQQGDASAKAHAPLPFEMRCALVEVIKAAGGNVSMCEAAIDTLSARGAGPYNDVRALAGAVREIVKEIPAQEAAKEEACVGTGEGSVLLMSLLYAPRTSRLHAMAKTLCRIENLSYICAWTASKNAGMTSPPIECVDLPRLKLTFTAREDHQGILRLFSVDHADLFISNERDAFTTKMLTGIPHSLLLSNLRGETQLLVPVVPPKRPLVLVQPFSTELVLERGNLEWLEALTQRYFLYPVHVSLAFVMTKGLHSALYLLLLRLLHR
jgi:hypothetical protein